MPLFVIERKNTARKNSLAVRTYLMVGFNNSVECVLAWKRIVGEDHPVSYVVLTIDEYIDSRIVHEIVNEPSVILMQKGDDGRIHLSMLPEISSRLIAKKSLLIVNVGIQAQPEYYYSGNKMIRIKNITDNFISKFLFDREKIGRYIHMIGGAGSKLRDVVDRQYSTSDGNAGVVIIYDDLTISNIQLVENELFGTKHESILVTEYAIFQIIINDSQFVLKHIAENS